MDSVTQFTLGAAVGAAVMGRRLGLRKAALTGGLIATLPDLDVFLPNDDPVDSFVSHRSATHSLLVHSLLTPVLGEFLRRLFAGLKEHRWLAWGAVFLCLTTHALLDSLTIYGTQLFWPLWKEPVGLGSVFIIDPLYTLPLLIMTLWALFQRDWSHRFGRGLVAALVLSSGYLGWGMAAQAWAFDLGQRELAKHGIRADQALATPVAFSSLFWRIIATDQTHDYSVYIPLLGGEPTLTTFRNPRLPDDLRCWVREQMDRQGPLQTLAAFSDGYFRLDVDGDLVRYSDLRMGLSQSYAFQFHIARRNGTEIRSMPAQRVASERNLDGDFDWLLAGVLGRRTIRPAEHVQLVNAGQTVTAPLAAVIQSCPGLQSSG